MKGDITKTLNNWKQNWPDHKFNFENDLEEMVWEDFKRDQMMPKYHQHKINEYIKHYLY